MKFNRYVMIIAVVVVAAIIAGVWYFRSNSTSTEGQFETVIAEKGKLTAQVGATGTVRANQTAMLIWQTTGTVEKVTIKAGDEVAAGDVLASLEVTSLPQQVILAQADLLNAQRTLDDLKNSNLSRAKAEQVLANAQKALDDAKTKVEGLDFQRASDTYIKNTQDQLDLANEQVALARKFYNIVANLPNGDSRRAQASLNLTNAELRRDELIAQLNYVTGKPDDLETAQRRADYEVALAQVADAQRKLERVKDGADSLDIESAQARIAAAQATLNQANITAPFAGVVTVAKPLVGDQTSPGMQAFRVDDFSHLLVDVQVSEIDINTIEIGQPVTIGFDAILGKTYNGIVSQVGRVGSVVQGAVEFTVTVELTDADDDVKPGMTAAVNILVKELDGVLLVPNRAVRVVDGQRVVYILKDGQAVSVQIRLGASSDTVSEVIGGDLKEGDLIILNPPVTFGPGGPMGGRPGGGN